MNSKHYKEEDVKIFIAVISFFRSLSSVYGFVSVNDIIVKGVTCSV